MKKAHLDFETRSTVNIKTAGAAIYASHHSTEILCLSFSYDDKPVQIIKRDVFNQSRPVFPSGLLPFVTDENYRLMAHSAFFEYQIWENILHKRFGWPSLKDPRRWGCTLAKCAAANLPFSLDNAGAALKIEARKMAIQGRMILNKLSSPQGLDPIGSPIWNEDPKLYEQLYEYCQQDVRAEMEIDKRLPDLTEYEQKVWELDMAINARGILADTDAATKAMKMADSLTVRMNKEMLSLSGGMVEKVSQPIRVREWLLCKHNIRTESLDKQVLAELLARKDLPAVVHKVLYLRSQGGKSSTSKYKAILATASPEDGRIRGALQYHGAGTGRWAGRLVQFQNLPQGTEKDPDAAIDVIKGGDAGWFEVAYQKPMETLSSCIRGVACVSGPDKKLLCADYAGIETCVLMWAADETEALDYLRAGKNLYVPMAEQIFKGKNKAISKHGTPFEYKVGKMTILGSGYQMWWPRFVDQCATAGVILGSDKVTDHMTDDFGGEADPIELSLLGEGPKYVGKPKKRAMTEAEVMGEEAILAYREKYKKVVQMWKSTEATAILAIKCPGTIQLAMGGKVKFGMSKSREFLCCQLPSGRWLSYFKPSVRSRVNKFGQEKESIHFFGEDSMTGMWVEQHTYGGKLVENIIQAIARDIMANGMLKCEAGGFPVVLTVHDELVVEVPKCNGGKTEKMCGPEALKRFISCMCDTPEWAKNIPITAEGWAGLRYRK